jgi:hypothetical protein
MLEITHISLKLFHRKKLHTLKWLWVPARTWQVMIGCRQLHSSSWLALQVVWSWLSHQASISSVIVIATFWQFIRSQTLPHLECSSSKAILKVRKSVFRSTGSIPADDGATESHEQLSNRGRIPIAKMVRLRLGMHNIIPCWINQHLASTLVDSVFSIIEFKISHVSNMGIISLAEIVPKHIPCQINDMILELIDDWKPLRIK